MGMKKANLYFEFFIQLAIAYSLVTYFVELEFARTEHSRQGPTFFLWSERAVAAIFTIEYLVRWWAARDRRFYPFRPLALIDLMAVLPFYVGFMVDMRSLRLIRTLRMLRLLKVYRYSAAVRTVLVSYARVKDEILLLGTLILLLMLLSGTIVFEAEREVQPDKFSRYSDGLWWSMITLTTVGYGDVYPVTLTGRIAATVTLFAGLGIFGSFVSLLGGSFMLTVQENKDLQGMRLSRHAQEHLVEMLTRIGHPVNPEEANRLIETALDYLRLHSPDEKERIAADVSQPECKLASPDPC
jgi:voltage-gated potassium channel